MLTSPFAFDNIEKKWEGNMEKLPTLRVYLFSLEKRGESLKSVGESFIYSPIFISPFWIRWEPIGGISQDEGKLQIQNPSLWTINQVSSGLDGAQEHPSSSLLKTFSDVTPSNTLTSFSMSSDWPWAQFPTSHHPATFKHFYTFGNHCPQATFNGWLLSS